MGILTIIFVLMIVIIAKGFLSKTSTDLDLKHYSKRIEIIKAISLLGLTIGILGNLIGFYSAFERIEIMGNISPGVLAGGLKISLITPLYGLIIFIIGRISTTILLAKS